MEDNLNLILGQSNFTSEDLGHDIPIYDDAASAIGMYSEMDDMTGLNNSNDVPTPTPSSSTPRKERSDKERSSTKEKSSSDKTKTDKDRKDRERSDRKDDKERKPTKDGDRKDESHKRHRDSSTTKEGKEAKDSTAETPSKKPRHEESKHHKSHSMSETAKERRGSSDLEGDFLTMVKSKIEESTDSTMGELRAVLADYKRNEFLCKISSALGSTSDMEKLESSRKELVQNLRSIADKYEAAM